MQSLVDIGPVVLEKKILKFRRSIFASLYSSPFWKGSGPSFQINLNYHLCIEKGCGPLFEEI